MSYENRGKYNHDGIGRQLLRFDGLEYDDHITPMDVDAYIEYHDMKRVLIEVKMKGVKMLWGQRTALERMVNDFTKANKDAIAIVAEHTEFDKGNDVMLAQCIIRELYYGKERRWRPPKHIMTVEQFLRLFLIPPAERKPS